MSDSETLVNADEHEQIEETKLQKYISTLVRRDMLKNLESYLDGKPTGLDKDGYPIPITCDIAKIIKITMTYRTTRGVTLKNTTEARIKKNKNELNDSDKIALKFYNKIKNLVTTAYHAHYKTLERIEKYCITHKYTENTCLTLQMLYLTKSQVSDDRDRVFELGINNATKSLAALLDKQLYKSDSSMRYKLKIKKYMEKNKDK